MAKPVVTCNADVILSYSASPQTVVLGATATGSPTSWHWTMLSVPPSSTANVGVKGSFTDGVATIQNPSMIATAAVDGGYTIQCVATNGDGDSDPLLDRCSGQQAVIVRTAGQNLWLPGDYLYDWGEKYLNPTLRLLESALENLSKGGGGCSGPEGAGKLLWRWNEKDLTEFDEPFIGSGVDGAIEVVTFGGKSWVLIDLEGLSGDIAWRDLMCALTVNVDLPADCVLMADVLVSTDIEYQNPFTVILATRSSFPADPEGMGGYCTFLNYDVNEGTNPSIQTIRIMPESWYDPGYGLSLKEAWEALQSIQTFDYSGWDFPFNPDVGGRYGIGAVGPSEGEEDDWCAEVHRYGAEHRISTDYGRPDKGVEGPIEAAGKPGLGLVLSNAGGQTAWVCFTNIAVYEMEASSCSGGGESSCGTLAPLDDGSQCYYLKNCHPAPNEVLVDSNANVYFELWGRCGMPDISTVKVWFKEGGGPWNLVLDYETGGYREDYDDSSVIGDFQYVPFYYGDFFYPPSLLPIGFCREIMHANPFASGTVYVKIQVKGINSGFMSSMYCFSTGAP